MVFLDWLAAKSRIAGQDITQGITPAEQHARAAIAEIFCLFGNSDITASFRLPFSKIYMK